jgi:hypothetical protein
MSVLQEDVRLYLVPMLLGQPASLHRKAQKTLAAWIAMTTMTSDVVDKGKTAIPQIERTYLLESRLPPRHWVIFLTAALKPKGPSDSLWYHNVTTFMRPGDDPALYSIEESNTQTATIRFVATI